MCITAIPAQGTLGHKEQVCVTSVPNPFLHVEGRAPRLAHRHAFEV